MIKKPFFSIAFTKHTYCKSASAAILTAASIAMMSDAVAQSQWAVQLKVSPTCTGCHTNQSGTGSNAKPAAKAAYKSGGVIPGLQNFLKLSAPVLLPVDNQWNVQVGEVPLALPLSVKDKEADAFIMQLTNATSPLAPKGYTFSKPYTVASSHLPAIDLNWKPTAAQKNKNYTAILQAKETAGGKQLSNTVTTNIFVWAARAASPKNVVEQFSVDTAKWAANKLTMTGRIIFKKSATAAAKATALKTLQLNIKSNAGTVVGKPVVLKPAVMTGAWTSSFALTGTQVPCLVKAEYEKLNAARTVKPAPATCIK